jgi:hypothetical protein
MITMAMLVTARAHQSGTFSAGDGIYLAPFLQRPA